MENIFKATERKCRVLHVFCISYKKTMTDFSKRIFQNGQFTAEFFFHKIYSLSGKERYQVSVKDEMNRFIFFTMEQGFNSWKIINAPKVPDWIMQLEDKLKDEILKSSLA